MTTYEGRLSASGMRMAIVVGRFNEFFTRALLEGAQDCLRRYGAETPPDVVWVPGAYEIPLAAQRLARSGTYDAIVCLGAVIRGATAHFDYVSGGAANGIARVGLDADLPVIFGVLTTDTMEQTMERAGSKGGNKGFEAALTAIEMVDLLRQLPAPRQHRDDHASEQKGTESARAGSLVPALTHALAAEGVAPPVAPSS